jgi:hypothetical protein
MLILIIEGQMIALINTTSVKSTYLQFENTIQCLDGLSRLQKIEWKIERLDDWKREIDEKVP